MEIVQMVNRRYPIRLFLPGIQQSRGITISFAPEVDREFCARLLSTMDDMSISLSTELYGDRQVVISIAPDAGNPQVLVMHCRGFVEKQIRMDRTQALYTAAWTVYALATGQDWFDEHTSLSAEVRIISLEQQILVKSLLDAIAVHKTGEILPNVSDQVTNAIRSDIKRLASFYADKAPQLSCIPIPEARWSNIQNQRLGKLSCGELLHELGCDSAVTQDVLAYCQYVRTHKSYRDKLSSVSEERLKSMQKLPLVAMENFLNDVKNVLSSEFAEEAQNAQQQLQEALKTVNKVGKPTAKNIVNALQQMDPHMQKFGAAKLASNIFLDYLDTLSQRVRTEYQRVMPILNRWGIELSRNCYFRGQGGRAQQLGWLDIGKTLTPDMLQIQSFIEPATAESMLASMVQGGYSIPTGYMPCWICGDEAYEVLRTIAYTSSKHVSGVNKHLLIVYLKKGLVE